MRNLTRNLLLRLYSNETQLQNVLISRRWKLHFLPHLPVLQGGHRKTKLPPSNVNIFFLLISADPQGIFAIVVHSILTKKHLEQKVGQLKQLAALHRVAKTGRNQVLYNISIC